MINLRIFSLSEQGYVCPVGLPREFLEIRHDQDHFNYLWIFLRAHSPASTPIKTLLLWNLSLSFPCFLALNMISKQHIPKLHMCVCVCVLVVQLRLTPCGTIVQLNGLFKMQTLSINVIHHINRIKSKTKDNLNRHRKSIWQNPTPFHNKKWSTN